jgi:hypothetical protein
MAIANINRYILEAKILAFEIGTIADSIDSIRALPEITGAKNLPEAFSKQMEVDLLLAEKVKHAM